MLSFFFSSALSALHLYNEPKFMVIGNPVILEQSHAHNAPDLWNRGSNVGEKPTVILYTYTNRSHIMKIICTTVPG